MSYKSRKDFLVDCIIAAYGTVLDEAYTARNFEEIIGHESPVQNTCSLFITFAKTVTDFKYLSKATFNDFLFSKTDRTTLSDQEASTIDCIFEQLEAGQTKELKDPKQIYTDLLSARNKINLWTSLNSLTTADRFEDDAVTWSDEYCETLQSSLESATDSYKETSDEDIVLYSSEDIKEFYSKRLEERKNGEVYSFHNRIFDELITEGPTPGHGGIIGGSTGMGKSTLCLNLVNDLINADVPTIYCPIEMGLENTIDRLVSLRTGYPFKDVVRIGKTKEPNNELEAGILHEIESLTVHPNFAILNKADLNLKKLKSYIKQFQAKLPGKKYCIVLIDLVLMMQDFYDASGSNMAQNIERAINKLDILAKELGVHWIGVVQLGRAAESDKVLSEQSIDKLRPTRTSIKNSNALLERARWAITIFRKKYFADLYLSKEEADGIEDIAEIQLMKANDEEIARRYARFEGKTFKMTYDAEYGQSANGF